MKKLLHLFALVMEEYRKSAEAYGNARIEINEVLNLSNQKRGINHNNFFLTSSYHVDSLADS